MLLDMVQRGELSREGAGSLAKYTVVKLREPGDRRSGAGRPSEKEKAYQALRGEIHVPRDADVGSGDGE